MSSNIDTTTTVVPSFNFTLPPYSATYTKVWFVQLNAIFTIHEIHSQKIKFDRVVKLLPHELVKELGDIPETNPYDFLKTTLIKRNGPSKEQKMEELLHGTMGDRKPSQLFRRMKYSLGGDEMSETILRCLWLRKLPNTIVLILMSLVDDTSLEKLADIADNIFAYYDEENDANVKIKNLEKEVKALQEQVQQLQLLSLDQQKRTSRNTSQSRDRTRRRSHSRDRTHHRRNLSRERDVIGMNYLNLMLQDTLILTNHVQQAAIIDVQNQSAKALSVGFKLEDDVIKYLLSIFRNPMGIRENGIEYEGKTYRCIRAEKQSIYAKLGKRGLVLVHTKTLLILASFSETMLGSVCVEAVEKLADYFRKKDM